MAQPFVKWAGGKAKLAPLIAESLPATPNRYFEPFAGGGAVYFELESRGLLHEANLNDLNGALTEAYTVVRDQVEPLIAALRPISRLYLEHPQQERAAMFYRIRRAPADDPVERAARLIFLNRTCFNGLFRVNRRGEFNVPHGTYSKPRILDSTRLREASRALQAVTITSLDFEELCGQAGPGDFVYLDPPYQPLSATASFTSYTGQSFTADDQRRLAECVARMSQRGALVMVSNSAHPFIEELYAGFYMRTVKMSRAINSAGHGRAPIDELLITNWDTDLDRGPTAREGTTAGAPGT
jgi:DNA adenine methylase